MSDTATSLRWEGIIAAAHADNEKHGVPVRGGKKYSQVATRLERFRLEFGDWGIHTTIVEFSAVKGDPVVVRAAVITPDGFIVATGHAFEIVGQGNVNSTSALENAETSAIGRALAVLGLHGGEMASLNEIEAAGRKSNAPAASPTPAAAPTPAAPPPADEDDGDFNRQLAAAEDAEGLRAIVDAIFRIREPDHCSEALKQSIAANMRRLRMDVRNEFTTARIRWAAHIRQLLPSGATKGGRT